MENITNNNIKNNILQHYLINVHITLSIMFIIYYIFSKNLNYKSNIQLIVSIILVYIILITNFIFCIKKYTKFFIIQIKKEIKLKNNLKSLYKEKNNLFIQIIHDLKNPLSVIKISNNIISQNIKTTKVKTFCNYIENNTIKLEQNILNILKLEKINDIQNFKINNTKFNLNHLIIDIINETKIIATYKNIDIKLKNKNINYILHSDKQKIKIILDNIISNALKFANKNITIQLIKITNITEVHIINDGEKISNKIIQKINNNLNYISDETTSSGYGLNIIMRILPQLHGYLKVNNLCNNGVKFVIGIQTKNL